MEIENILFEYFYQNPSKRVDDILQISQEAYKKAKEQIVPKYKPRKVDNLSQVSDEYDAEIAAVKRREYHDESTFEGDYDDGY